MAINKAETGQNLNIMARTRAESVFMPKKNKSLSVLMGRIFLFTHKVRILEAEMLNIARIQRHKL